MKTTDPRICPDAHRIKVISFDEAAELAYFGAKVLHPATVLPAVEKNIPVLVLNSRNPENEGTRIVARTPQKSKSLFKAIAAKQRITIIEIVAARMLMAHGFLAAVFEIFKRHRCAVDIVSTSEVSISVTVDSNEAIPAIAADLEKLAYVKFSGRQAIICLVGESIRERPGVAAQVFDAVKDINVRMISQGASEINMSFVVDETDVPARDPAFACADSSRKSIPRYSIEHAPAPSRVAGAWEDWVPGGRGGGGTRAPYDRSHGGRERERRLVDRARICRTSMRLSISRRPKR